MARSNGIGSEPVLHSPPSHLCHSSEHSQSRSFFPAQASGKSQGRVLWVDPGHPRPHGCAGGREQVEDAAVDREKTLSWAAIPAEGKQSLPCHS